MTYYQTVSPDDEQELPRRQKDKAQRDTGNAGDKEQVMNWRQQSKLSLLYSVVVINCRWKASIT